MKTGLWIPLLFHCEKCAAFKRNDKLLKVLQIGLRNNKKLNNIGRGYGANKVCAVNVLDIMALIVSLSLCVFFRIYVIPFSVDD